MTHIVSLSGSFDQIQQGLLSTINWRGVDCGDYLDLYGQVAILIPPTAKYETELESRGYSSEYAETFFEYVYSGKGIDEYYEKLCALSNNAAAKFLVEFNGRNTQYGPRIQEQLPAVIKELTTNPNSRRAWIQILNADDQFVLDPKNLGESTIEYPCTSSLGFKLNPETKLLDGIVTMRSSDATLVLNYDVFNFVNLLEKVANQLGTSRGTLSIFMASSHMYKRHSELVCEMAKEYADKKSVSKNSNSRSKM